MSPLRVLVVAALASGLLVVLARPPSAPVDRVPQRLPWQVTLVEGGGSSVFGIRLGKTTLAEAEGALQADAELTLFREASGTLALEAFFDNLVVDGLMGDFVLTLSVPVTTAAAIYQRGLRVHRSASGVKRVRLDPADHALARDAPVEAITYLPSIDLDAALLEQRFGPPAARVPEGDRHHWRFPRLGLDIVVDPAGREVFQYVAPRRFAALLPRPDRDENRR